MKYIDCETDLSHERIWCVAEADYDEEPRLIRTYNPETTSFRFEGVPLGCAHNAIGFERHRVLGVDEWLDTLVMSRLYDPSMEGGHSLKAWGQRLGFPKDEFPLEQFDIGYTDEMGSYCQQDVRVLQKLQPYLTKLLVSSNFSQQSIDLEHDVAIVTDDMCRRGFPFNKAEAEQIHVEHMQRQKAITLELQERWPPIITERWSDKTGKQLKDDVVEFNVGSRQQIADRLAAEGVEFKEFTPTGRPKIDETTLADLDHPAAALCSEYLSLMKLGGMVQSWLKHVEDDGRIRGRVNPCGAVTGRMTHSNPNLGQIPRRGGTLYRRLFTASEGKVLVGADASGLELRMLAHYMKDDEYINQILEGDIHEYNQKMAGLPDRDSAKTFIYAFLYGAGDAKLGTIVGGGKREGAALRAEFLGNLPKLRDLQEQVRRIAQGGSVPGLDGRRIRIRSEHAALNTLLQGAGAVVMKQAMVAVPAIEEFDLLMHVHDEFQGETEAEYANTVGRMLVNTIVNAGRILSLRCPLDGEFKVGETWAETH